MAKVYTKDDWLNLLRRQEISTIKKNNMLKQEISNLDIFLKSDPYTEQRVVDILSRRLSGKMNDKTWRIMHDSLAQYFTEGQAYLLYWVVAVEDPTANRLPEVEKFATPSVMAFLRSVVGIFGEDLSNAFALSNQIPNNWRFLDREVYFNLINKTYRIKVKIEKYNGEEFFLEGPPDFVLNMVNSLLYTASLVGTRKAFSKNTIDIFLRESKILIDLFTAKEEKAPAESTVSKASSTK